MNLTPNSWGSDLRESNDCHAPGGSPEGGQFCGKELPGLTLPAGTTLYHGTVEPFEGPLTPGIDALTWFAETPKIARSYLPDAGSELITPVPWNPDSLVRPGNPWPDKTKLDLLRQAGYHVEYNTDPNGELQSWGLAKDSPKKDLPREQDLMNWYESLGYKAERGAYRLRMKDINTVAPADYQIEGRLFEVRTTKPLRLLDWSQDEGDLTEPQHQRYDDMVKAKKAGYDGIRMSDFGQSKYWGNFHHVSIGLFPKGLAHIDYTSTTKTTRMDGPDLFK